MDTPLATLRILAQSMFHMILRAVDRSLAMDAHRTVAMHTPDGAGCCVYCLGDWDLLPPQLTLTGNQVFALLLATQHQIMRHLLLLHPRTTGSPLRECCSESTR